MIIYYKYKNQKKTITIKSLKNMKSLENIKNLGNNTNSTYAPYDNIDTRNFTEPANIFMKNFFNYKFYDILPKGEYHYKAIDDLGLFKALRFRTELCMYIKSILNKHVVSKKPKYYYDDGTVASYSYTYDSFAIVTDAINHFKNCYEIQCFIDAWLIDSDEDYSILR